MMDRFKEAIDDIVRQLPSEALTAYYDEIQTLRELATESEQLRKRLAELETLLAQANSKIQWYERTEAKND